MLGECFDPKAEKFISELCRPHWSQAGAVVFITYRTHDSIPSEVIERWDREKEPFDHLVRNPAQYDYLRRYIADNPHKAGLTVSEYLYRRFNG